MKRRPGPQYYGPVGPNVCQMVDTFAAYTLDRAGRVPRAGARKAFAVGAKLAIDASTTTRSRIRRDVKGQLTRLR